jgi:plasmid stability protein
MTNLTIAVEEEVLKRARIRAIEEGTSVNAVLRERLTEYAQVENRRQRAIDALLESARKSTYRGGGKRWTREEIHERGRPR